MDNFKYKIKEANQPKVGDIDVQNGTKYTVIYVDPESGAVEWSVEKVADYESAFETLHKTKELFDSLIKQPGAKDDIKIRQIAAQVRDAVNNYRTHLRKNYPEEFNKVKSLSEESTTGGGVGQAGFTSGTSGENYATPKAFKYKLPKKPLKEDNFDVNSYTDELNIQNPQLKDWIKERIGAFDDIEKQLNVLVGFLQQAKQTTIRKYSQNPNFEVIYGTDMAKEYLNDLIELFKKQQ